MDNNTNYNYDPNVVQLDDATTASRRYMANVFLWMFVALGISAFCAYWFASTPNLIAYVFDINTGRRTGLGTVLMFSPIIFALLFSTALNKMSFPVMAVLFIIFSALMGSSLSFILLIFTAGSVASVFVTASALFGIMAIAGYATHQDLTKLGSFLMMGLIGLITASFVNFFFVSEQLFMIINYAGVALFIGITAYQVQMLKRMSEGLEEGDVMGKKLAIFGAFQLYLTFVNLFLFLLNIFGRRR